MKTAPLPDNETLRVMALERLGLLDTPPDAVFDNLAQAAASLCDVPIALICLVDANRQWFKSCVGLDETETSRDVAFCAHTILQPGSLLEIEDATLDDRFDDNPLVSGDPKIRFYAGQPLVTSDGFALGTLCVIDRKPRKLNPSQRDGLTNLAAAISNLLDERRQSPAGIIGKAIESTIEGGIVISEATEPEYQIIYCNHGFEKLTGYTQDEILGRSCQFLQGEGTNPVDVKRLREALAARQEITLSLKNYRKDGSVFWNELTISPIRDETGTVSHFLGIQRDVSDLYLAEDRVARLDDVVDASVNEIFMVDEASLRFVYVNQRARDNLGYTMEELREMTPLDIGTGAKKEAMQRFLRPFREGKKLTYDFETVHRRKDGSTYPTEIQLQHSQYESKPVIIAIALDLTSRKKVEKELARSQTLLSAQMALRQSEERYRDLFENAHDLVQSVLPDGSFAFVNPAWKSTLGYTDDEIKSLTIFDIIHPDDRAHCQNLFEKVLKGENVGEVQAQFITKDRKTVFVKGSVGSHLKDKKPVSTRAIFHNITEHVNAEKALKKARDIAEQSTKTKSRFLAAASHDLRQPLQSVDLNLSVLNEFLEQPDAKELSESIRCSLNSIREILDVLLDISQLDSGSIKPKQQHFEVTVMLKDLVTSNQAAAQAKGLELRYETEPHTIFSDPALLIRILENFISNAIQYTNQGEIVVKCYCHEDVAVIGVQDTGIGIPSDSLETIFADYSQLNNPNRDRRKGLGLGLTIAKHVASLLDHKLAVKSTLGKGSSFNVEVPIGKAQSVNKNASNSEYANEITQEYPIVLFVDDFPDIVRSAMRLFKLWGVDAQAAHDANEAIALIERGMRPELVISDYRLPGISGIELIQKIREMTSLDLPAILITGDGPSEEIKASSTSLDAVLHKPIRSDKLKAAIKNAALG